MQEPGQYLPAGGSGLVNPVKTFKDSVHVCSGMPIPVSSTYGHLILFTVTVNRDLAFSGVYFMALPITLVRSCPTCVCLPDDRYSLPYVKPEILSLELCFPSQTFNTRTNQIPQGDVFNVQADTAVMLGKDEKILNKTCHTIGFIIYNLKKMLCCGRILPSPVQQGFSVAFNRSQGCSQFVGYIGYKLSSHVIQLLFLRDILNNGYQAIDIVLVICDGSKLKFEISSAILHPILNPVEIQLIIIVLVRLRELDVEDFQK